MSYESIIFRIIKNEKQCEQKQKNKKKRKYSKYMPYSCFSRNKVVVRVRAYTGCCHIQYMCEDDVIKNRAIRKIAIFA